MRSRDQEFPAHTPPGVTPESFDAAVQAVSHFHQPALPVAFHEGRAIHLGPRGRGEDHPLPDRAERLPECSQGDALLQLIPTALSRLFSTLVDDNIHVSHLTNMGKGVSMALFFC